MENPNCPVRIVYFIGTFACKLLILILPGTRSSRELVQNVRWGTMRSVLQHRASTKTLVKNFLALAASNLGTHCSECKYALHCSSTGLKW